MRQVCRVVSYPVCTTTAPQALGNLGTEQDEEWSYAMGAVDVSNPISSRRTEGKVSGVYQDTSGWIVSMCSACVRPLGRTDHNHTHHTTIFRQHALEVK